MKLLTQAVLEDATNHKQLGVPWGGVRAHEVCMCGSCEMHACVVCGMGTTHDLSSIHSNPQRLHHAVVPFVLRSRSHMPRPFRSHVRVLWSGPIDNLDPFFRGFVPLWVQKAGHRSTLQPFVNRWMCGTLSLQGRQITEWVPMMSSAVGVHMESLDQAPPLPPYYEDSFDTLTHSGPTWPGPVLQAFTFSWVSGQDCSGPAATASQGHDNPRQLDGQECSGAPCGEKLDSETTARTETSTTIRSTARRTSLAQAQRCFVRPTPSGYSDRRGFTYRTWRKRQVCKTKHWNIFQ